MEENVQVSEEKPVTSSGTAEERRARDPRLGRQKARSGDGGLSWSNADQRWIGTISLPRDPATGKRRYKRVTDRDYNKALQKLQDARKEINAGLIPTTNKDTVKAWLEHWLENIHKPNLGPKTLVEYRRYVGRICGHIGAKKLQDVTSDDVLAMNAKIIKESGGYSTAVANQCYGILKMAMQAALQKGMIRLNPLDAVKRPKDSSQERDALTSDQALHLLRTSLQAEDRFTTRYAIALMLGCRQGEMLGLEWDRIDFEKKEMHITWQLQRLPVEHGCGEKREDGRFPCTYKMAAKCPQFTLETPPAYPVRHITGNYYFVPVKTKSSRRVMPLPKLVADTLMEHKLATADEYNPHNLVWTMPGGKPIPSEYDLGFWSAAVERAGLPHVPLHSARHTTATLLLEAGVDVHIISQILGHSAALTTHRYSHVNKELARQSLGLLGGLLGGKKFEIPQ